MRARGFVAFAVGAIAFRNHFNFPSAAVTRNASEPRALANTRPQVPANRYYLQFRSERESKQYGEFCISELSSLRPEVFGPASRLRTKCIRPAIAQNHLSGFGVYQELSPTLETRLIQEANYTVFNEQCPGGFPADLADLSPKERAPNFLLFS